MTVYALRRQLRYSLSNNIIVAIYLDEAKAYDFAREASNDQVRFYVEPYEVTDA